MILREELDLLWFIENQRLEKSQNEHFGLNHQIDIKIKKLIYE